MSEGYKSDLFAAIHETVSGLHEADLVDKKTMRDFDGMCLTPVEPLSPDEIRTLREKQSVSQAVFARYLNVSKSLISQWERGEKQPAGASLKLLMLVRKLGLQMLA